MCTGVNQHRRGPHRILSESFCFRWLIRSKGGVPIGAEAAEVAAIGNGLERLGLENSLRLLGTLGASRYNPANTRRSMLMKVSRCGDLRPSTLSG